MKNPGKALRDAYMTALNGLTYQSVPVGVYDDLPIVSLPDRYVYINAIDVSQKSLNNSMWDYIGVVTLDVVVAQVKKPDRDIVDGVAEAVMNAIMPTVNQDTLTDANFQFLNVSLDSDRYITIQDGATYITRKILRFSQTVIQK